MAVCEAQFETDIRMSLNFNGDDVEHAGDSGIYWITQMASHPFGTLQLKAAGLSGQKGAGHSVKE